ncbi:hypothetical protein [Bizionia sp. M204]|uniref:hypothetical protein n=1 Tax=Bizionia sp. M204 TaxID=2675331 RepID=UPI00204FA856|nr:hypothetical protein [Bizionia sp. M204]UPS92509.1 hypothetical protein GMA17_12580 [Bizionia sp. M204]
MAFLFTNCEPDINTDIKAKESSRFSTQDLNTEQIRSKKHITEKLEDLNLENAASHDSQNKIVYNGSYGFTVNTDLVKYVEDLETGNHSYSFSIQRDSTITNNLENLLLQYNPADSDYYAYIVQYAFTNDELQDLNETFLNSTNTIIFPIDYDISTLELGKMTWGCVSNGHWVNNTDHNGELHGANCTCDSESTWVVTEVTCGYYDDGSGSGDGSTNSPWIPNTGNEPGGGYGDPNNPNNNGSGPTEIFAAPTPTQTQAELLATYLDLNPQQEIWANKSQNENQVRAINNYLFTNCGADTNSSGCQQAQAFVVAAMEAIMNNEVDNLLEYISIELENELVDNPYKLVDIDCNQIEQWQALVQFSPPPVILDKLNEIDEFLLGGVSVQTIENAEGAVVNLDYFPIIIDVLPNNPSTGERFSAEEFLEYIRIEINIFINNDFTEFIPSPITGFDEEGIWLSANPLGAIISLDIPGAHDGSVVCSENTNSHWVFTTLTMPWGIPQGLDGPHPVSGNRQIGYEINSNGTYTFYSRGVDRMESNFDVGIANYMTGGNPFDGADALWSSFQQKVQNFTNNNGGVGNATPITVNRPEWEKVKNVLLGNRPISDLGCE